MLTNRKKNSFLLLFCICFTLASNAQFRKLGFVYSENIKGGSLMIGNTLMYSSNADSSVNLTAMNGNNVNGNSLYDNGNFGNTKMLYVDIDGDTGIGATTKNSSSADLILPAGTNKIKLARLYWGGRALTSEFNLFDQNNQTIKIKTGTSNTYTSFAAAQIDRSLFDVGLPNESARYQAFADITDFVATNGTGTYTVADGAFSEGLGGSFGNYGAWCMVIVYENELENFNSVRLIDGFQEVYSGGGNFTNPIQITGLNVPNEPILPSDIKINVMSWEGDARFDGDFFKINNILFSNARNQPNNCWNGTITIDGEHVTTKNPNYTDQMSIDIDQIYAGVGYNVQPKANSISLQFGTNQDQYFSGVIATAIKMKESTIKISKSVTDASNNQIAQSGEVLTYTIKGRCIGTDSVRNIVVTDSLPAYLIYVPNSLNIVHCTGMQLGTLTDTLDSDAAFFNELTKTISFNLGSGSNGLQGGTVSATDSFEISFKASFNPVANGQAPPVINVARVTATSNNGDNYIDDATIVINGATAQKITYNFTGNGNWSNPNNWSSNKIPPPTLPVFSVINIDHQVGGSCILDVPQNIASGAILNILSGKNLSLPQNLIIQ
jgi:uncharacterized repeat protein (TIGR01451 family)